MLVNLPTHDENNSFLKNGLRGPVFTLPSVLLWVTKPQESLGSGLLPQDAPSTPAGFCLSPHRQEWTCPN